MFITGLAIPYGVPNVYNETLTPTALSKDYLAHLILPMLFDHDRDQIIGLWNQFDSTPSGLYVRGFVFEQAGIDLINKMPEAKRGLSVSYSIDRTVRNRDDRYNFVQSVSERLPVFEPLLVDKTELAEISVVDAPAWKQCFFQVLP